MKIGGPNPPKQSIVTYCHGWWALPMLSVYSPIKRFDDVNEFSNGILGVKATQLRGDNLIGSANYI
jgi:hypothetical protein